MRPASEDDYYELLGVDVGADDAALRRAWRLLAARWHPDRAGAAATGQFQRISAAYEVLSDPLARAAYDRRRGRRRRRVEVVASAPTMRAGAPAVMLSRLCGQLDSLLACGAARLDEPGAITLVLRQAEAAQGGMASVSMYVGVWCPDCAAQKRPGHGMRPV